MNFSPLIIKIRDFFTQNYITKAFTSFLSIQVIGTIVGLVILSLYTKHLSPEDYGRITFVMILVMILSVIIDGGLNTAFSIKFYKISEEENKKNIYTILIYNFIVLTIFFLVFILLPTLGEKLFKVRMAFSQQICVFGLIFVTIAGKFYTNFLTIAKKPKKYFIVSVYFHVTLVITSFLFLLILKSGYFAYIYSYLIAHAVLTIIGVCYFLVIYRPSLRDLFSCNSLISLLKLGLPLVPNSLLLMLLTYVDRYILGQYNGLASVGIYSVGYVFADKIYTIVINPAGQAMTPLSFQTFARSISEYKVLLKKVFESYWLMIEMFLIIYFSFLREVFEFVVGKQYTGGFNIIPIVVIGTVFFGAASMVGGTIVMKEKTDKVFLFSFISVVLNIVLNFMLIPKFGIYGAAIATLLSYVVYFQLFFGYTQKLVYVPYNMRLIALSGLVSLIFLIGIVGISYLQINIFLRLLIKIICSFLYILTMQKFFGVKHAIRQVLQYGYSR
ncbi:MAG: oligosaccharide flippase family protein [bacterium]|nr:oligosaccharide flippase family protein [bacterium]